MVTDEDIIAKAVWKLDIPPGEVTRVFNRWVETALRTVREGGRAQIPGVGTLAKKEGRVVFTPQGRERGGAA